MQVLYFILLFVLNYLFLININFATYIGRVGTQLIIKTGVGIGLRQVPTTIPTTYVPTLQ